MEQAEHPSFISIARIARPRGNRGEVLADLYSDFPARFESLLEVWVEFPDRRRERLTIEESWIHKNRLVLKFAGTETISAAEKFAGAWVQVEAERAVPLPEGTYFDHDLVGCNVLDVDGKVLGSVREVLRVAGNTQLVVERRGSEFMVPAVGEICVEVSISKKQIRVNLPKGLIDLNE